MAGFGSFMEVLKRKTTWPPLYFPARLSFQAFMFFWTVALSSGQGLFFLLNSLNLSAGQKRSAAIATVLAMSPDILALDEPTSGLDPRARRGLLGLLQGFTHTKIIAAHDLDMILCLCTRVIVLREGTVAADGPAADLLCDEALLAASHLERPLSLQACPICGSRKAS
jgi:ABC-type molybdate transport system ATPase subunit